LRKDISNLLSTDNPTINPSLYTNPDLVLALNERFLFSPEARNDIKQRIDDIYRENMPFIILGKEL
jgi:ABC-type transport system substrate-binding protein